MNRFISLSVLLLLIVCLGGMLFQVIAPFVLPLFIAAVLAVIVQPLQNYFLRKTGQRTALAAALTTTALVAMLIVPIVVGTFISAVQLYSLTNQHLDGDWHKALDLLWNRVIAPGLQRIEPFVPGGFSDEPLNDLKQQFGDSLQKLAVDVASRTFQIASSTVGMFVSFTVAAGMFVTALYYFLADGPALIAAAEEMIPLPVDHQRRLCERFATVVRAVVTATFLSAFIQGFATAAAIQLCGIGYFWIFLAVATVASLIPLVGAWIVWGPCAIWLALQGHWVAASLLTVWGVGIVSMLDNVVKIYVLQNDADLHPLLAFISVVGALQVLGLWGIFIGPIVASCLYALIQIFNVELKEMAKERHAMTAAFPPDPSSPPSPVPVPTPSVGSATSTESTAAKNVARQNARSKQKRRR